MNLSPNILRGVIIFLSTINVTLLIPAALRNRLRRLLASALAIMFIHGALEMLEAWDGPIFWWRTPLLFAANLLAVSYLWGRR